MRQRGISFGIQKGVLALIAFMLLAAPAAPLLAQGVQGDGFFDAANPFPSGGGSIFDGGGSDGGGGGGGAESIGAFGGIGGDVDAIRAGTQTVNGETITTNSRTVVVQEPEGVVKRMVYFTAVNVSGYALRTGGWIFDVAFNSFVLQLGCWFVDDSKCTEGTNKNILPGKGQVGDVVNQLWQMVRDIFNIIFIFALIYIGIRTILFTEDSSTRRMIGLLIVAALLINFSLYFAKTIVDFANFSAVQLHQNLNTSAGATTITSNSTSTLDVGFAEGSIAGHVMSILNFASIFQAEVGDADLGQIVMYSIMMLVFSLILAFTFAYAGIMLLFRFMALVFYLILSPFMFLSWVVPQFASYGKQWWGGFLGYAFYAPVFMFFIYLSLYTLSALGVAGFKEAGAFANTFAKEYDGGALNSVIYFVIAIGFVLASTRIADTVAKQSGAIGMSAVSKFSKKVTIGAGAMAGGYAASYGLGAAGKGVEGLGNKMGGRYGGASVSRAGMSLQKTSIGGASSFKDHEDAIKEHDKKRSTKATSASAVAPIKAFATAGKNAKDEDKIKMERAIAGATSKQLETMGAKTLKNEKVAATLSGNQYDALMKSDELNDTEKKEITEARQKGMLEKVTTDGKKIGDASVTQLEALGAETLFENADKLSSTQMDDLKKKLTETEFGRIKDERKEKLKAASPSELFTDRPNKEIAKLPKEVYAKEENLKHLIDNEKLTGDLMKQIARESDANKREIGNHLVSIYPSYDAIPNDVRGHLESPDGSVFGVDESRFSKKESWSDPVV